jgi:hypothetical protein
MGAARSTSKQTAVDKPAEGESLADAVTAGLEEKAAAEAVKELGLDPADVDRDRVNNSGIHPTVDLGETARSSVRIEDVGTHRRARPDVLDNYRQLKEEQDLTWEQVADRVASSDPRLAAYFRSEGSSNLDDKPKRASASGWRRDPLTDGCPHARRGEGVPEPSGRRHRARHQAAGDARGHHCGRRA